MKKIIVVDDDHDNLEVLSIVLKEKGCKVFGFLDGTHLLERVTSIVPDLIILDIFLFQQDGRDLCKLLKNTDGLAQIPVLLMSAWPGLPSLMDCKANGFINKPYEQDHLYQLVDYYESGSAVH